jgi:hypothetical protein
MVEVANSLEELFQQINTLKLTYGDYLNLKKTLNAFFPKKKEETEEDYTIRLARELDEEKNEVITRTVSSFSNAATFVVFEVESLKENLPAKDVEDLFGSYKNIETNARPTIDEAKKFVQAANNIKVKLANTLNVVNAMDKAKTLSQSPITK